MLLVSEKWVYLKHVCMCLCFCLPTCPCHEGTLTPEDEECQGVRQADHPLPALAGGQCAEESSGNFQFLEILKLQRDAGELSPVHSMLPSPKNLVLTQYVLAQTLKLDPEDFVVVNQNSVWSGDQYSELGTKILGQRQNALVSTSQKFWV